MGDKFGCERRHVVLVVEFDADGEADAHAVAAALQLHLSCSTPVQVRDGVVKASLKGDAS